MDYTAKINDSLAYLSSPEALASLERDAYWPKWSSPYWQMLLLHEMGEAKRIPRAIADALVAAMNRYPVKIFPIHEHEMPAGIDPQRGTCCHCQLGNVYQVLSACGIDVEGELPWIRPWILRYQMADGGLTCDNHAYRVHDEVPSSMVGTIAPFEAILLHTPRAFTAEETKFLDKGAEFLIDRQLRLGSPTNYNAAERESAKKWVELCFPRFYYYDVLRGLNALLLWREKTGGAIPESAIKDVVEALNHQFPNGEVTIGRQAFKGMTTVWPKANGEVLREQPALEFPLLMKVSEVGQVSPFLSLQWKGVSKLLNR